MVCEVDVPVRCIFLADAATIRQRRKRFGIFVEALKTSPERMDTPRNANRCIDEGPTNRTVSPEK